MEPDTSGVQTVIYITKDIYNKIAWKKHSLDDILNFEVIHHCLSDEEMMLLLYLNSNDENRPECLSYQNGVGVDNLLRTWYNSFDHENAELLKSINNLNDLLSITKVENILEKLLTPPNGFVNSDNFVKGYDIESTRQMIFVILKNNEYNLLNKEITIPMSKEIVVDILKTINLYHNYQKKNNWLYTYIKNL